MPIENLICNVEEDNVLTLDLCTYKTENMADYSIEKMVDDCVMLYEETIKNRR